MKLFFVTILLGVVVAHLKAQNMAILSGTIVKNDSLSAVYHASIRNLNNLQSSISDESGNFTIHCSVNDTLEIYAAGFATKQFCISTTRHLTVVLEPLIQLNEVQIIGKKQQSYYDELRDLNNKKNAIYYNGRPPLALLSPFGGQPITYFYERLSKGGRKARKLEKLASQEKIDAEIDKRFTNGLIQEMTTISDDDIETFKSSYRPTSQQIQSWSEYELIKYIKESFRHFARNQQE